MTVRERNLRRALPDLTDAEVQTVLDRLAQEADLDQFERDCLADFAALDVTWGEPACR